MTPACALCGAPCRKPFQAPPPELAPDLDLRPGEPTRSTLASWIATCRTCGASAPDLARLPQAACSTVQSEAYTALKGSAVRNAFLRWAMLAEATNDRTDAAEAVLHAAWAEDDAGADAAPLRRRAAQLWGEPDTMQDTLRLIDILRRAADFPAAGARAAAALARPGIDETDAAVLRYQQTLIAAVDAGRHLLSSALRPPARTPHVTHGRPPARGFWQRLVGR